MRQFKTQENKFAKIWLLARTMHKSRCTCAKSTEKTPMIPIIILPITSQSSNSDKPWQQL